MVEDGIYEERLFFKNLEGRGGGGVIQGNKVDITIK